MLSAEGYADLLVARLQGGLEQLRTQWRQAVNTARYCVVDDLLPGELANEIAERFPDDTAAWRYLNSFRERKHTFAKLDETDPAIARITDAFHAPGVLGAIGAITALEDLQADPSLYAGGVSLMTKGDFLNPHIDNSHDAERRRYRRLNLLYYVSPNWRAENGGNLELWDAHVRKPLEIVSHFNRLVVMETTKTSWHSVNPVRAKASRRCISNYYFSAASPDGADYHHVTSFLGRPDQPLRRAVGRVDNALRQTIAKTFRVTRGKHLRRETAP
ncbi:MAG: 2OG-Fe(II) oxygenase [Hyphococcus sp.]